jgi:polar amino acid transport system permease protein
MHKTALNSTSNKNKNVKLIAIINTILIFTIIILFIILANPSISLNSQYFDGFMNIVLDGYKTTILITIIGSFFSFFFGLLLFLMRNSKILTLNYFAETWIQIIIGIPLYVQIIILYFLLGASLGLNNPVVVGTLILTNYIGAYVAKTFEGAYRSIPSQQHLIINMLNLRKTISFRKIIFPQMLKVSMPSLTSHLNLFVKSSALLSLISVSEFTNAIQSINSTTNSYITGYIVLAIGYLLITIPLNQLTNFLERKISNGNKN